MGLKDIHTIICPVCRKAFTKTSQLNCHLNNLDIQLLRDCKECSESPTDASLSDKHPHCSHDTAILFCSFCKSNVDINFIRSHACFHKESTVQCRKQIRKKYTRRNWPPPPYVCSYCGKVYGKYGYMLLLNHEKRHQNVDSGLIQCKKCNIVFESEREKATHNYKVHKKVKLCVCDVCGLATKHIARHRAVHRLDKTFQCEMCPKVFRASYGLKKHMMIHSNESKYKCTVCGKAFTYRYNMKVHMRIHADVKPFVCYICDKTFTTKQWRDKHVTAHH